MFTHHPFLARQSGLPRSQTSSEMDFIFVTVDAILGGVYMVVTTPPNRFGGMFQVLAFQVNLIYYNDRYGSI